MSNRRNRTTYCYRFLLHTFLTVLTNVVSWLLELAVELLCTLAKLYS
jgi:hypothetical protein